MSTTDNSENTRSKLLKRFGNACTALFVGMGVYLGLLELGTMLSLVPARFEESVNLQITIFSHGVASGSYVVFMFWGTILFFVVSLFIFLACGPLPEESSNVSQTTETPSTDTPALQPRMFLKHVSLAIYCACAIINDAVVNRADGTTLVKGGLDRVMEMATASFIIYLKQMCFYAVVFLVVLVVVVRKQVKCLETNADVENGVASAPDDTSEKVGLLSDVDEKIGAKA